MRSRGRKRVNWDAELSKTERIRRRGIFISLLGFGIVVGFMFWADHESVGPDTSRKIIFTFCLMVGLFLTRLLFRRKERLLREREESEEEEQIRVLRRWRQEKDIDKWTT